MCKILRRRKWRGYVDNAIGKGIIDMVTVAHDYGEGDDVSAMMVTADKLHCNGGDIGITRNGNNLNMEIGGAVNLNTSIGVSVRKR